MRTSPSRAKSGVSDQTPFATARDDQLVSASALTPPCFAPTKEKRDSPVALVSNEQWSDRLRISFVWASSGKRTSARSRQARPPSPAGELDHPAPSAVHPPPPVCRDVEKRRTT